MAPDVDTFNFLDKETLDKIDRIVRNGGAGDSEELGIWHHLLKDGNHGVLSQIEHRAFYARHHNRHAKRRASGRRPARW
jgi:hypothetical protein